MVSLFFSGIHFQNILFFWQRLQGFAVFCNVCNVCRFLRFLPLLTNDSICCRPGGIQEDQEYPDETEVGLIQTKVLICLIQWLHRHSLSCQCQSGAGMGWAGRAGLSRAVESFQLNDMISLQKSSSSS